MEEKSHMFIMAIIAMVALVALVVLFLGTRPNQSRSPDLIGEAARQCYPYCCQYGFVNQTINDSNSTSTICTRTCYECTGTKTYGPVEV